MTRDEAIARIRQRFADDIVDLCEKSPKRVYVEIKPEAIVRLGEYVFRQLGARFNIASGVDTPTHIEILYHFTIEEINLLISLRVRLDKQAPAIDSLAPSIKAVDWIEREISELLGVTFNGHPDPRRLLLPEQWPEGVFPLRREYQEWDESAVRDRGV
jgi:Ni,Fe-hydrogenase III component G